MKQEKGKGIYNVIAIGAGTAGLITTSAISGMGGRAALIERNKMGGDCLNFGCVPSKGLISSARAIQNIRHSERWGLEKQEPIFDFKKVFERMRARRAIIEPNDSVERYEQLGVDVFQGDARFISPHEVEVNGQVLRAKKIVIAAGSRAGVPPIDGIDDIPFYTNETIFDRLNEKPESMIVIGGGPIGAELGQAINRLGVKVKLVEVFPQILIREDPEVSQFIRDRLNEEGLEVHTGVLPKRVYQENGRIRMDIVPFSEKDNPKAEIQTIEAETLLVAAGRIPNVEKLNLEAAKVDFNKQGIIVNENLQTSQPHIYAAGDIVGPYQFTHMADHHARTVVGNIVKGLIPLPLPKSRVDYSVVPWATYTSPEVARVGLNETEAISEKIPYDKYNQSMAEVDRAILESSDEGFIKVLTAKGTDKILGVTIVAEHAGDILHEFVLAMKQGIGLGKIANTIHAYPTFAEAVRKVGDSYNRTRLTARAKSIFTWLFQRQINR